MNAPLLISKLGNRSFKGTQAAHSYIDSQRENKAFGFFAASFHCRGFLQRSASAIADPLHARALVLSDGKETIAIVIVDYLP